LALFKSEIDIRYFSPVLKVFRSEDANVELAQAKHPIIRYEVITMLPSEILDLPFFLNRGSSFSMNYTSGVDLYIFSNDRSFREWSRMPESRFWIHHSVSSTVNAIAQYSKQVETSDSVHIVFANRRNLPTQITLNITVHHTEFNLDDDNAVCGPTQSLCVIRFRYK